MLKAHSPLGENASASFAGLNFSEIRNQSLVQIAGSKAQLKKDLGQLPELGKMLESDGRKLMRLNETQVWVFGAGLKAEHCVTSQLSSSRTCIEVSGQKARALLATSVAVDFTPSQIAVGNFVLSGIHHTPVLITCVAENTFHIYAMRTFALSLWEWLTDAALGLN